MKNAVVGDNVILHREETECMQNAQMQKIACLRVSFANKLNRKFNKRVTQFKVVWSSIKAEDIFVYSGFPY